MHDSIVARGPTFNEVWPAVRRARHQLRLHGGLRRVVGSDGGHVAANDGRLAPEQRPHARAQWLADLAQLHIHVRHAYAVYKDCL